MPFNILVFFAYNHSKYVNNTSELSYSLLFNFFLIITSTVDIIHIFCSWTTIKAWVVISCFTTLYECFLYEFVTFVVICFFSSSLEKLISLLSNTPTLLTENEVKPTSDVLYLHLVFFTKQKKR